MDWEGAAALLPPLGFPPLQEPLALYWDKRRPLPRYAIGFGDMLAQHMRNVFPISRPSQSKTMAQKTVFGRRQPRSRRAR
jgi:hypothetical protein